MHSTPACVHCFGRKAQRTGSGQDRCLSAEPLENKLGFFGAANCHPAARGEAHTAETATEPKGARRKIAIRQVFGNQTVNFGGR